MTCYIAGVDVEWPLVKVIITFCCNWLWKSKFMSLAGNLSGIFSPILCGDPVHVYTIWLTKLAIFSG